MKKQEFYIFYSEKDEIHLKLVKAYANRFCIDEDDQSEVMGFYPLGEISETNLALSVLKYLNPLKSYKSEGFQKLRTVTNAIIERFNAQEIQSGRFGIHFIIGIPENHFIIAKLGADWRMYLKLTLTLLNGQIEHPYRHTNQLKNKFTIGDDIDLLNDQSEILTDKLSAKSKCLSFFKNFDDVYGIIKCNRQSYGQRDSHFPGWYFVEDFCIRIYFIFTLGMLNGAMKKWFVQGISEMTSFDSRPRLGFLHGFLVGFLLILQISYVPASIYMIWKFLRTCYSFIFILFIPTGKLFRGIALVRICSVIVFLGFIIIFTDCIYQDTASLIANMKHLFSLTQLISPLSESILNLSGLHILYIKNI